MVEGIRNQGIKDIHIELKNTQLVQGGAGQGIPAEQRIVRNNGIGYLREDFGGSTNDGPKNRRGTEGQIAARCRNGIHSGPHGFHLLLAKARHAIVVGITHVIR